MTTVGTDLVLDTAEAVAARLSDALALPVPADFGEDYGPGSPRWRNQSLSKGAPGVVVLHSVRAQQGHGSRDWVRPWLTRATRDDLSAAPGAGLWFGAPAVAFALTTAAPGQYPHAMTSLDAAIGRIVRARLDNARTRIAAGTRPSLKEFDLVRGLTGLGAYLLRRGPHGDLLRQVLAYLVQLTEPVPATDEAGLAAPGWWTSDVPSGQPANGVHGGHADLGMAHGITGPLALLALAAREGVMVAGHAEAIERIFRWLDTWRHDGPGGAWWPERITLDEFRNGLSGQVGPARPSWCYGTPGIARAQQLAALALHDPGRQEAAEQAFAQCLADPMQLARIIDPALCHGWAGLVATAFAAHADAQSPILGAHLPRLLNALIDHADDPIHDALAGLIDGRAGIALTLHTIATRSTTRWQTCLLIN